MAKHPFRAAIEGNTGDDDLRKLFASNVVIKAPMLTKPIHGAENVLNIISHAAKIAGPIHYTREVRDSKQTILFWDGKSGGFSLQAATILVEDDNGLIREVRVVMRPWPVVTIFRDEMRQALSASIPEDHWELQPKPAGNDAPRQFTAIALKPIELADDVTLHSPMLAKSAQGKAQVSAALRLAHQTQSASLYTSIIATPDLVIEVFDCDADGHPMEGIWVKKVNEQGEIYDFTVYLRPYPAVTVLRNRTEELGERTGCARWPGFLGASRSRSSTLNILAPRGPLETGAGGPTTICASDHEDFLRLAKFLQRNGYRILVRRPLVAM